MVDEDVLTVGELARRLKVTRRTIRAWTADGKIPAMRIGEKTLRYDWGRVVEALERRGATHAG
ncbi:MAG TPA: helix-turn-helix domain-containing protein [Phycisphaerae bacterium]|nr:helix-turn-helix domain-containing protein [Phycisphaerae bacterium]